MAVSDAEVCNLALLKVGEKQLLDDVIGLAGKSTAAKACNALFNTSRDALLESYPWPFATRHALLAVVEDHTSTTPTTRRDFAYIYDAPADMLAPRFIWSGAHAPAVDQQIPFDVEDDATYGAIILTDMQSAELIYTRKVTEVVKMTPLFQEALSWKLAYELCFALEVKPGTAMQMLQGFQVAADKAAAASFKHMMPTAKPRPGAVRIR